MGAKQRSHEVLLRKDEAREISCDVNCTAIDIDELSDALTCVAASSWCSWMQRNEANTHSVRTMTPTAPSLGLVSRFVRSFLRQQNVHPNPSTHGNVGRSLPPPTQIAMAILTLVLTARYHTDRRTRSRGVLPLSGRQVEIVGSDRI